jgi:predicted AAA+ superfamily ATPase
MEQHYERLFEYRLRELLKELPAIAVDGLKGVGKTVSASRIANTMFELDRTADFLLLKNDFHKLLNGKPPVLIDEWQKIPEVWDYVRRQIDQDFSPGAFLLTGSVSAKNLNVHSGAGRIVRMRMFPLSLAERNIEKPTVSLGEMLNAQSPFSIKIGGETAVGLDT